MQVPVPHPPQLTWPLPQAFSCMPHSDGTAASEAPLGLPPPLAHSGGSALHTPPCPSGALHSSPLGHVHWRVCPQPSLTVPQRLVLPLVQLSFPHALPPSSAGASVVHTLFTHDSGAWHPPQLTATPHESTAMSPHLPVHDGIWQL